MMRRALIGTAFPAAAALIAVLLLAGRAGASENAAAAYVGSEDAPTSARRRDRIELRRQNTERGTPEESTRTTLRLESYFAGTVSRLRLDLPFPDEKTGFAGDPFQPRLGDIKARTTFRPFQAGDTRLGSDVEMTFPTADSRVGGSDKYQVSAALHSVPGAPDFALASGRHQLRFEWTIRQTVSVAGEADAKNINNTKPELGLRDSIGTLHWLKLTFKPTIDWIQDGKTGAVLELEGGWNASREWRLSIKGGAGLWGEGTPGFYHRRLELVAGYEF